MFGRAIILELEKWLIKPDWKPLVVRGARQVGKTTVIHQFARQFDENIYLNLEIREDRQPFLNYSNLEQLLQTLFFLKNKLLSKKENTLIFIDEIQEVHEALNILRYFYEQEPTIKVVAAGSMPESIFDKHIHFPVGRIEYKVLRPVSFPEFLEASGETAALKQLQHIPLNDFAHDKLLNLYHQYAIIGGMPEVDFLMPYEGKIIPIETKSGKTGTLRSLHQFMDEAPHTMAVRFYIGDVNISEAKTPQNKTCFLLNLPYYLVSQINAYLK